MGSAKCKGIKLYIKVNIWYACWGKSFIKRHKAEVTLSSNIRVHASDVLCVTSVVLGSD